MAASKIQANWSGVSLGSAALTKVTSVNITTGGSITDFAADTDLYPTLAVSLMSRPKISVTTADEATAMTWSGAVGTFTATHKDAKLATGGDVLFTVVNCVTETVDISGAHAAFGQTNISLMAYSTDGVTSPISFTRA